MEANQLTIVGQANVGQGSSSLSVGRLFAAFFGKIVGWVTRLVGCSHTDMSSPISVQGQTYRTCLDCGAQRKFDLERWEMQGSFYYRRPAPNQLRGLTPLRDQRRAA